MGKTINFTEFQNKEVYSQEIIDFNKNIMLKIYKLDRGFAYRYVQTQSCKEFDPLTNSAFNWAYGLFSCPNQAIDEARNYYLENILT